ncbi:MAG: hypothetical protein ABI687_12725 [Flavitalea sp.]
MLRKSIICSSLLIGVVIFALASSGGGKKKSSTAPLAAFTPVHASGGFTLRSNPAYAGSRMFNARSDKQYTMVNSLVTYQKGNTTYIVPARYKINSASRLSFKSNLNLIDLKIRICK